jgi:hypothetical protein
MARASLVPKPALLWVGQFATALAGGMTLLLLALAPFDAGTFTLNGEEVSGPEFLRRGGGLVFAVIGGLFVAIAVGLWRGRGWSRPLMLYYWFVIAAIMIGLSWQQDASLAGAAPSLAFVAFAGGIAAWYLYRKENVVAYFEMLRQRAPDAPR